MRFGGVSRGVGPRASGFTLVEMLVVIGIVALLMGILLPTYLTMARQNRRDTCAASMKALGQGLAMFYADYGCYPPDTTEYLWTPSALAEYRAAHSNADPPGDSRYGSLMTAAYDDAGNPVVTTAHGRGLLTLYLLGAYASALPPATADLRFSTTEVAAYQAAGGGALSSRKGFSQFTWFRGSGYISKLERYHCPENPNNFTQAKGASGTTAAYVGDLLTNAKLPVLGTLQSVTIDGVTSTIPVKGYNNYDQFYRRNFWNPGYQPVSLDKPAGMTDSEWENQRLTLSLAGATRNLCQPNPPVDTVVTWCPYHHRGYVPQYPGDAGSTTNKLKTGDYDLVLMVDGSVRRVTSRQDGKMYMVPTSDPATVDTGWPHDPIM